MKNNIYVQGMLESMEFKNTSTEEVFKFQATTLIEDFKVPASFVIDMMHSLKAAVLMEEDA